MEQEIAAYIAGDDGAGNSICRELVPVIRAEVNRFLPTADFEHDDVVQDTLIAFLAYLRRAGRGPDRPKAFVVTMAGNRCRNLHRARKRRHAPETILEVEELPGTGENPHTILESRELEAGLRRAFARLDAPCRQLLWSIYVDERPMEALQREAGLGTVQGIYYRKYACLKKLYGLLKTGGFGRRDTGPERPSP